MTKPRPRDQKKVKKKRLAPKPEPPREPLIVYYSEGYTIAFLIEALGFGAMADMVIINYMFGILPVVGVTIQAILFFVGFGLVGVCGAIATLVCRTEFREDGIRHTSPLCKTTEYHYQDIDHVTVIEHFGIDFYGPGEKRLFKILEGATNRDKVEELVTSYGIRVEHKDRA